jgi:hypothetical protein
MIIIIIGRNENDLENEIKIVHTIRYKYEFWFRKMCKNMFKKRQGPKQNAYRKHI